MRVQDRKSKGEKTENLSVVLLILDTMLICCDALTQRWNDAIAMMQSSFNLKEIKA